MKKNLLTSLFLMVFVVVISFAQPKSKIFISYKIDLNIQDCSEFVDKESKIQKEFGNTTFVLKTKSKVLQMKSSNEDVHKWFE